MREKSAENNGKYVAVHLRFEEVGFLSPFVPETIKYSKGVQETPKFTFLFVFVV
jgi:hypothetical protein